MSVLVGRFPRRLRWALAAAGLVLIGWLGFAAISVTRSLPDIRFGQDAFADVRRNERVSEVFKGSVAGRLRDAEGRLTRAHERLAHPLLAPLRVVPVGGRQLRSLAALSEAGAGLARAGADGIDEANRVVAQPATTPAERIAMIRSVGDLAERTRKRLADLSLGPEDALVSPLARARGQLARDVADLEGGLVRASAGARVLSDWFAGPRRYLVFAANNAEMRAGSGMFLSLGVLETAEGRLRLGDFRTVVDFPVPPDAVSLDGDLAARWGWLHPNREWRNLMASPRFEVSAALAAQMWTAAGQPPVDGVIAIDPVALEGLLKAVGPVAGPDRPVDASTVVYELLYGQYLRLPASEQRPERREQLGAIARAVFTALDSGTWDVTELADGLVAGIKGRHLMLWSARPEEQAGWRDAGADGGLRPDSLLVSVLNRAGNKLDRFLLVTADVACSPSEAESECLLRLQLSNVTPTGEPAYIAGPHPRSGVNAGDYLGIVTVSLPGAAREGRIDGVEQLAVGGADGPTRVIGTELVIPRNERRELIVRFRLPGDRGALQVEPSGRVPGIEWSSGVRRWSDGRAWRFSW